MCVLMCEVDVLCVFCCFVWAGPGFDGLAGGSGSTGFWKEALACACGGLPYVSTCRKGGVVQRCSLVSVPVWILVCVMSLCVDLCMCRH